MGLECVFELGILVAYGTLEKFIQHTFSCDALMGVPESDPLDPNCLLRVQIVGAKAADEHQVKISTEGSCPYDLHVSTWRMSIQTSETDLLAFEPRGFGFLKSEPFTATFPSLQFTSLLSSHGCLYLGVHDHKAFPKQFSFDGKNNVSVTYPGSSEMESRGFTSLPFKLARIDENCSWMQMADMYKSFASKTSWYKKGLDRLKEQPDWIQSIPVWFNTHWQINDVLESSGGNPQTVVDRVKELRQLIDDDIPILLHWYEWDLLGYTDSDYSTCKGTEVCGFDSHYPEYFPARTGFDAAVEELEKLNVFTVPYINGRLFDRSLDVWSRDGSAKEAAVLRKDGSNSDEDYGNGVHFASMCPATEFWQSSIAEISRTIISEAKVSGIYIDQIAAADPEPCFNHNHDHALGGGSSWTSGYNHLIDRVRDQLGPDKLIITESNVEQLIGSVDTFLTLVAYEGLDHLVPAFQYVYPGGVTQTAGAIFYQTDLTDSGGLMFIKKLTRMFMLGSQLGWMALGGRNNQEPPMSMLAALKDPQRAHMLDAFKRLIRQRMDPFVLNMFRRGGLAIEMDQASVVWSDGAAALIISCNYKPVGIYRDIMGLDLRQLVAGDKVSTSFFVDGVWVPSGTEQDAHSIETCIQVREHSCTLIAVEAVDGHSSVGFEIQVV